jgi:3-hydroxyisobutyrate dehydrogenase
MISEGKGKTRVEPDVRVAVLGLGAMGSRIAARLAGSGVAIAGWNRTKSKLEPLLERGVEAARSPSEAVERADVIITMLSDVGALRDVVVGKDGMLSGMSDSATVIEMSTVGPRAIEWLASTLPDKHRLLDAPVLGSIAEAERGQLSIFVGGRHDIFAEQSGLLSELGSPIHIGPLGSGAAAKLLANLTLITTLAAVGEAVALADAIGLERGAAWEVLAKTPIAAQVERRRPSIEADEYPLRFALALAKKDAALITEAAADGHIDLRLAAAAESWLSDADQAGLGNTDYSAVLRHILRQSRAGRENRVPGD